MKQVCVAVLAVMILSGCATYQQLKPKPELSPAEQGFIELKRGDENFELKKDQRYYIAFPAAPQSDFVLMLSLPEKRSYMSFFTNSLVGEKKYGEKITDESPYPDTVSVFALDKNVPLYYWLINKVPLDMPLRIQYRYVPRWRFTFEVKYAVYKPLLAKHVVDRGAYKGIGGAVNLETLDLPKMLDTVSRHTGGLEKLHADVVALESVFPGNIRNSNDVAFANYVALKKALEEEIAFQKNFTRALAFFNKEKQCRDNPVAFVAGVEDYISYFTDKNPLPENISKQSLSLIKGRLDELLPFYNGRISNKSGFDPFDSEGLRFKELGRIGALYEAAKFPVPPEYTALVKFFVDFNAKSTTLSALQDSVGQIATFVAKQPGMPDDELFKTAADRAAALKNLVPQTLGPQYGVYAGVQCAGALNAEITKFSNALAKQVADYRSAESVVPRLNELKAQKKYSAMLGILKQMLNLTFLTDKYQDLDTMSINGQARTVVAALDNYQWSEAERGLTTLQKDNNFLNMKASAPVKERALSDLEDLLYNRVEQVTRSNVNKFLLEKINTVENVDSLYTDSVFLPVYNITFSSGTKAELYQRKNTLVADLANMKSFEFPAKAVKLLFDEFVKNPDDNGVLKARAIVTHGNHYLGDDKDVKLRVAECNPELPKFIVKPKDYRRVFALPVTDSRAGRNKYKLRFNINIPTDAMFPVYDLNIKLPREVAQNAATTQWYEKITLNGKPLKSEGRFTIVAPSADNNYECQISPVQMNKDKSNILEITFNYRAFKVFSVSTMVQKPIIKKN